MKSALEPKLNNFIYSTNISPHQFSTLCTAACARLELRADPAVTLYEDEMNSFSTKKAD